MAVVSAAGLSACAPQGSDDEPVASEPPAPLAAGDARTYTKLIEGSVSADDRFAVAVGTADRSRPDWLPVRQGGGGYSYQLSDYSNTANYLVSLRDFKVLAKLDSNHSGTARFYNHESAAFHWSLDSRWFVEEHHWKWHTAQCTVHRLDPSGKPIASLDLKSVAQWVLMEQFLRSVRNSKPEDFDGFAMRIKVVNIANDGFISANLTAQMPKQDAPYMEVKMTARVMESAAGRLKVEVISP